VSVWLLGAVGALAWLVGATGLAVLVGRCIQRPADGRMLRLVLVEDLAVSA
jgi:hypothetical protein